MVFLPENSRTTITEGYVSPQYREKRNAPVFQVRSLCTKNAMLPTVIVPYAERRPMITVERSVGDPCNGQRSATVTIRGNGFVDRYIERSIVDSRFSEQGIETDARILFLRTDDSGKILLMFMRDGTFAAVNGTRVIELNGSKGSMTMDDYAVTAEGVGISGFNVRVDGTRSCMMNGREVPVEIRQGRLIVRPEERSKLKGN
jgi:hypothetical protein